MSVTINGTTGITTPSLDNDGGTIDGTTIGGTTAAAGSFTTVSATGNLAVDTNTLFVDATNNIVGIGTVTSENLSKIAMTFTNSNNGLALNEISNSNGTLFLFFRQSSATIGSVTRVGTTSAVTYNTTSDYRLKSNQQPLTGSGVFIDALKPKTWQWVQDGTTSAGFIAHEFAEISPSSVSGTKDATQEEEYEVSPAVAAVLDGEGAVVSEGIEAVKGTRTVPVYQGMQASSSEVMANIIAELQSLRARVKQLEGAM